MGVTTKIVTGTGLVAHIDDLARLRIAVFREFPYLYDGDPDYERNYLRTYCEAADAMAVIAMDGSTAIGASTGIPMRAETAEFKDPFLARGYDPDRVFYCGESILLPAYRGQGLYRRFFDARESFAAALAGMETICFCAVVRDPDHPLKPADYRPLDPIWTHFGYAADPALTAHYTWKDLDRKTATRHPMRFWVKALEPA